MKKIIFVVALVFLTSAPGSYAAATGLNNGDAQPYTAIVPGTAAISGWVANFISTYDKHGIYQAVADVFKEGRTPDEITTNALDNIENINPQNVVAALYCAGAKPEDIRVACKEAGISEMILVAGFQTAKTVCGDAITDTQAYTPTGPNFAGIPGGGGGEGMVYGSPSGFTH